MYRVPCVGAAIAAPVPGTGQRTAQTCHDFAAADIRQLLPPYHFSFDRFSPQRPARESTAVTAAAAPGWVTPGADAIAGCVCRSTTSYLFPAGDGTTRPICGCSAVPTISWPRSRRTAVMSWPAMRAGNDRGERHRIGYRLHRALAVHRALAAHRATLDGAATRRWPGDNGIAASKVSRRQLHRLQTRVGVVERVRVDLLFEITQIEVRELAQVQVVVGQPRPEHAAGGDVAELGVGTECVPVR